MELNGIELAFRRSLGKVSNGGLIFSDGVGVALLQSGNLSFDRVQPVKVSVDVRRAFQETVSALDSVGGNLCLRGRELQRHVLRRGVGGLRVNPGGIFDIAMELVGISQFSFYRRGWVANLFQSSDGCRVVFRFAIEGCERAEDFGVVRRALLGDLEIAIGVVVL